MFKFITHRPLWVSLLAGAILVAAIFSLFILSLNWLTNHGSSNVVPSVTGKSFEEASKQLSKAGFDIEIQDSIYIDTFPPLSVIRQVPEADEVVKKNRTVYVTINRAIPPDIEMPNLIGYSYRNAEMTLKNLGLRVGDTTFKPDFARNSVLEQWYNATMISPGVKLHMGSSISLVLGDGIGKIEFAVPVIVGLTFSEAKILLEANGLVIGAVVAPGISDTLNAYINKQNPKRLDDENHLQHIRPGQTMDIWLQIDKPVIDTTRLPLPE